MFRETEKASRFLIFINFWRCIVVFPTRDFIATAQAGVKRNRKPDSCYFFFRLFHWFVSCRVSLWQSSLFVRVSVHFFFFVCVWLIPCIHVSFLTFMFSHCTVLFFFFYEVVFSFCFCCWVCLCFCLCVLFVVLYVRTSDSFFLRFLFFLFCFIFVIFYLL